MPRLLSRPKSLTLQTSSFCSGHASRSPLNSLLAGTEPQFTPLIAMTKTACLGPYSCCFGSLSSIKCPRRSLLCCLSHPMNFQSPSALNVHEFSQQHRPSRAYIVVPVLQRAPCFAGEYSSTARRSLLGKQYLMSTYLIGGTLLRTLIFANCRVPPIIPSYSHPPLKPWPCSVLSSFRRLVKLKS